MTDALLALEESCKKIFIEIGRTWEWDDRFRAVLLTYSKDEEAPIVAGTAAVLGSQWTSADIADAPDKIKKLVDDLGGLRAGQQVMHSDADGDLVLFAIFWPWGGGGTISLRIGVLTSDGDEQVRGVLEAAFGVV